MSSSSGSGQAAGAAADVAAPANAVLVRYWAGARAAAGIDSESAAPGTVAEVLAQVQDRHADLQPILDVCAFLLDGLSVDRSATAPAGSVVEVLPPFAGG